MNRWKLSLRDILLILAIAFSAGAVVMQGKSNAEDIQELRYNIHELRGEVRDLDEYVKNGMIDKFVTRREFDILKGD